MGESVVYVKRSNGSTVPVNSGFPLPVYLASGTFPGSVYETVAAGQTDQVLGNAGATGDVLSTVVIVPAAANCGAVSVKDGSGSAITLFVGGGTTALTDLRPQVVSFGAFGAVSTSGAWKVTTGTNVSVIATGQFT